MTAVIIGLSVVVAALTVLVAGLLRSHATILRRLHELDPAGSNPSSPDGSRARAGRPDFRTFPGVPAPPDGPAPLPDPVPGAPAADLSGVTPSGESVLVRTTGMHTDTVAVFLSSGCASCRRFFSDLADRWLSLPPRTRVVIVTKGPAEESPSAILEVAPPGVDLVMSSQAWIDFRVPGSPYVVAVDGTSGRVKGEGTGPSWEQVAALLAQATGDLGYLTTRTGNRHRPIGDLDREARVDRELLAAGVLPGDDSLYPDGGRPGTTR
jgi:hypothetical protein